MEELIITLETNEIDVSLESNEINANIDDRISIIEPRNHSDLNGLDYESSGHTGFASSEQLNLLVPKRLSTIPNLTNIPDRTKANIYVDNNGNDNKVSIGQMLNFMVRKGDSIPNDMQVGEYFLLEIE